MMKIGNDQIINKLNQIESEIKILKENAIDIDFFLSNDDLIALQEAEKDINNRRTKRL